MRQHSRALVAAAIALWLLRPTPALAHAVVLSSDPPDPCPAANQPSDPACATGTLLATPPTTVRVRFSEPVAPFGQPLRVLDPSGRYVERGPARIVGSEVSVDVDASTEGTYLVRWQVVSEDTHPSRGSFRFSVGRPSPVAGSELADASNELGTVAPIGLAFQLAARWLHYLGFALGFGVLAFAAFLLPHDSTVERRLARLVNLGILALLVAEPLALLGQTGSLGASQLLDPDTVSAALDSTFGRALALRLGAALLLWTLVGVGTGGSGTPLRLALAVGVILAFVDGAAAHAASGRWPALGLAANGFHLVAMGIWVGGLLALAAVWRFPVLAGDHARLVARFGKLATACLAVLAASGLALAFQHLAAPVDLLATPYGRALLAKLGLVSIAVLFAFVVARVKPGEGDRWRQADAIVVLGILALAGLLVSLPPPV